MAAGKKTGGRKKGSLNRITKSFKDAVRTVYEDIGGHEAFAAWARENPTEFYRIAARLIPTEIAAKDGTSVQIIIAPYGVAGMSNAPMIPVKVVEH